jgi:hypothetical protein
LKVEKILKIISRRGLCGSDVRIRTILSRQSGDGHQQTEYKPHKPPCGCGLKDEIIMI